MSGITGGNDSDASSVSSLSTQATGLQGANGSTDGPSKLLTVKGSSNLPRVTDDAANTL
jgi:hypothetical protein